MVNYIHEERGLHEVSTQISTKPKDVALASLRRHDCPNT